MAVTLIDQDVRQRIETDLATNLCVEASAGTGKTTVLVSRIVQILRSGHARIEELAVITFTEKAAAELSARVREGLEKALGESDEPEQADRIRTALRDLNRARIETIHAFASGILRERPVEAGLDPNFDVLDSLGSDLSFDEAYRRWLSETLSHHSPELWRAFNRGFQLSRLREVAELLHQHRAQLPLELDQVTPGAASTFLVDTSQKIAELRDLLADCNEHKDLGYIQVTKILELFDGYQAAAGRPDELDRLLLKPVKISPAGNKRNWAEGSSDQQKAICNEIKERLQDVQDALRTEALVGILPLVEAFVQSYAEQRRHAGTAEFDDLLIWTRDLLRDQPEVRAYFQQRFTCILVDEFQDTDPLQVEIVLYLTSGDTGERDWRKLQPLPGRLFVVGDPKQSIYRFRRADIAIYEWVKTRVLHDGLLSIRQNFRSVPSVIGWVNHVFGKLICEEEGIQPAYSPLEAARLDHELPHAPVVLVHGEAKGADGVREEEARLLAGTIERAVREERWTVSEGEIQRAAAWRDVAILLPSRTGIEFYERALESRGIPYRHEGGRSFFDRQEVRELISCLKAIDDPTDRLSLVAALRSGAFGCSDEELFRFVEGKGELDLRETASVDVPAVCEALATLSSLHALRGLVSLPELVGRVLEETRLIEFAITLPHGEQAAANLLKVADQARAFSGVRGGGLRAFVRWLSTNTSGRSDEADAAVAEARDDVVRILTIHGAKGLEFPIVALANLNTDKRDRNPFAFPDPKGQRLALSVGTKGSEFKTPRFDEDYEREKRHEEAEQNRLLYVAATRARDHLIVPAVKDGDKTKGMLASLLSGLSFGEGSSFDTDQMHLYDTSLIANDDALLHTSDPVLPEEVDQQEARRGDWIELREEILKSASQGLPLQLLDELDYWDEYLDEAGEEIRPSQPDDMTNRLDRALHRIMARVDLKTGRNLAALCRTIAGRMELSEHTDDLLQLTRNCLDSPVIARVDAAAEVQRGVSFSARLPEGGYVEGRVDLLFVEAGELVIVDFRTDAIAAAEIASRTDRLHENANTYTRAIECATGLPVKEYCVVFARPNIERSIVIDDDLHTSGQKTAQRATTST